jgi:hypothetical protein
MASLTEVTALIPVRRRLLIPKRRKNTPKTILWIPIVVALLSRTWGGHRTKKQHATILIKDGRMRMHNKLKRTGYLSTGCVRRFSFLLS